MQLVAGRHFSADRFRRRCRCTKCSASGTITSSASKIHSSRCPQVAQEGFDDRAEGVSGESDHARPHRRAAEVEQREAGGAMPAEPNKDRARDAQSDHEADAEDQRRVIAGEQLVDARRGPGKGGEAGLQASP